MKRREFITLLGGTAVAWPVAARAQTTVAVRRVGVLKRVGRGRPRSRRLAESLFGDLQELGWTEGRNIHFDTVGRRRL